jgi:hypothetical protein
VGDSLGVSPKQVKLYLGAPAPQARPSSTGVDADRDGAQLRLSLPALVLVQRHDGGGSGTILLHAVIFWDLPNQLNLSPKCASLFPRRG